MTKEHKDEGLTNFYAAVGIGFVCVVIGVPLWWKTTEVYRVSLPYADMETLADNKIQYVVDLEVISFDDKLASSDLAEMSKNLMDGLDVELYTPVRPQYRTSVRETTVAERDLLVASSSVADFDNKLSSHLPARPNYYYICLLPASSQLNVQKTALGLHRNVFMRRGSKDIASFSAEVVSVVRKMVVGEAKVIKGYNSAQGTRDRKPDKESMRSVRSSPGYDVTLTLVSPRPDQMDVQWDIEHGVEAYLNPLVKKMADYTTITVNSQVLFFTKLLSKPKKEWQTQPEHYYFTTKDLPLMINPLEARLVSPASTNPELNFLVYVPPRSQYPLYIRDENDETVPSNSFLSPQWGGIYIYNVPPPTTNDTLPIRPALDMQRVMEVFVSQLRLLLNLHAQVTDDIQLLPVGNAAVREWELDSWLRSRCVEHLATASASLKSLAQLLEHISNIVINDEIGHEVERAVDAIVNAQHLLREGSLVEAFLASKRAMVASEKAFFDPSLLELLYFPEDQKFAIYIPLFLPISFPVISSLWQAYNWYRQQRRKPKID